MARKRTGFFLITLIILMMLAAAAAADADTTFGSRGDGTSSVSFRLEAFGRATISFTQSAGRCMESGSGTGSGITGESEAWGKFHFYITSPSGQTTCLNWDGSYDAGEFSIVFMGAGIYEIRVVPYTAQEMTSPGASGTFLYWTRQPEWWISGYQNCASYANDTVPQYASASVVVTCVDEYGNTIHTEYQTVIGSMTVLPPAVSGYQAVSSGVYVTLNSVTGQCSPSSVTFRYRSVQPVSVPSGYLPQLPSAVYSLTLIDRSVEYIKPQCGPGDSYQVFRSMDGRRHLYNLREIRYINACFCTGDWVYVEFGYGNRTMHGFFRKSMFYPSVSWDMIPEYPLSPEQTGIICREVLPHNGPTQNSGEYESCRLSYGSTVYACMESNGWYLCRFYNDHTNYYGYAYLWVPGDSISWR